MGKRNYFAIALCLLGLLFVYSCASPLQIAPDEAQADEAPISRAVASVPFGNHSRIYQVMVDRFYDGDISNNGPITDTSSVKATNTLNQSWSSGDNHYWQYRLMNGGDWAGVKQKLSYIKGMGYNAIWISPTGKPQLWSPHFIDDWGVKTTLPSAYHGYNTVNPSVYNPYFGGKQALIDLVDAAHEMGISVIIDVVPNHVGDFLLSGTQTYSSAKFDSSFTSVYQPESPWNTASWYHSVGDIDFDDKLHEFDLDYLEQRDLGGLDDFDFHVVNAKNSIMGAIKTVLSDVKADAMRVDAAKCMYPADINYLEGLTGLKSFGECFAGDTAFVAKWLTGSTQNSGAGEWGMLDFPLYFGIVNTFAYGKNFKEDGSIGYFLHPERQALYGGMENNMVTFIDNHDRNRFLTQAGNQVSKMHQALIFLFAVRGVPVVFQGTEQERGNDYGLAFPDDKIADTLNRWSMFTHDASGNTVSSNFDTTKFTYKLIAQLNGFRDKYPAMSQGKQREMWRDDETLYAFSRRVESGAAIGQETVNIFHIGTTDRTQLISLRAESSLTVGSKLYNAFDSADQVTVISGGTTGRQISVTMGPKSSKIYSSTLVQEPPACPTGLTVTGSTSSSVSLSWTASPNATTYYLRYSTQPDSGFVSGGSTSGTSLTVPSLARATSYYFQVQAANGSGSSVWSPSVIGTTKQYSSNYSSMYLRGSMNSWAGSAMSLIADNTWAVERVLSASISYQYKYEISGLSTWSSNWGFASSSTASSASGTAKASGYNMYYQSGSAGSYRFTFNDSSLAYTVGPLTSKVETPSFNPPAGAIPRGTNVIVSSATPSCTIYYTTDGTSPSLSSPSGTANSSSATVPVNSGMTIRAIGVKSGLTTSDIGSASYSIAVCATPTFNPLPGPIAKGNWVSISSSTSGSTIYYSTDGSNPSIAGPAGTATASVQVNADMTIKAIAVKTNWIDSSLASSAYIVSPVTPGRLTIIFKTGANAENVSFPGDFNSWSLASTTQNAAANSSYSKVLNGAITTTTLARGSNATALELKLCNVSGGWSSQWSFGTWTKSAGISLSDANRQIAITCTPANEVILTIDVSKTSLSLEVK